jgi:hypothetical protein
MDGGTMADLTGLPPDLRLVINQALVEIDDVSQQIEAGMITIDEWQQEMAAIIDRFYQEATVVGAEGADVSDLSSTVNRLVAVQLAFLDNFADEIRETGWLSRYPARADMYGSAIKQGYWYGDVIAQVGRVLPLPAMPSEGTQCLCITTPESRVFTEFGYMPIGEVKPKTLVLTHKLRWRRVLRSIVHKLRWRRVLRSIVSLSMTQQQIIFRSPGGNIIGCTDDHLWLSPSGWKDATQIVRTSQPTLYKVPDGDLQISRFSGFDCLGLSRFWEFQPQILFSGELLGGTPLYDIEVEEDHSFIIEGVISHNSNDKCRWRIETVDAENGDYDAYWELSPVEHCQTCLERRAQWYPVQIRGGELVV